MIGKMKARVRATQDNRSLNAANSLEDLRKERMRLEGQAKILDLQSQEKAKLNAAKKKVLKSRFDGSIAGKVSKQITVLSKKAKEAKSTKEGNSFLPAGKDHPLFK
jgi:hypothetical protein